MHTRHVPFTGCFAMLCVTGLIQDHGLWYDRNTADLCLEVPCSNTVYSGCDVCDVPQLFHTNLSLENCIVA
jgi:hypothetical protein